MIPAQTEFFGMMAQPSPDACPHNYLELAILDAF
jgi:hypothetical protein